MRLTSFLIAALACALPACRGITDVSRSPDVSVAVDRPVASISVPVEITIRVLNRGTDPVPSVDPSQNWCREMFGVYDDAGSRVTLPVRFCAAIKLPTVFLAPGDSLVVHDRWSGDAADAFGRSTAVKAGLYHIVGRYSTDDGDITSAPVVVAVR